MKFKNYETPIGGTHQQTSERAAPPVSVEEKGKTTGEKKKIAIISAYEHTKLKLTVVMLLGGPQNTIKSHLVFTALVFFAPFSVFSSRMSAPYRPWQRAAACLACLGCTPIHGYATKEGCRTERKSHNLEYALGVRLTRFTT
jgi:hypothetical protein